MLTTRLYLKNWFSMMAESMTGDGSHQTVGIGKPRNWPHSLCTQSPSPSFQLALCPGWQPETLQGTIHACVHQTGNRLRAHMLLCQVEAK